VLPGACRSTSGSAEFSACNFDHCEDTIFGRCVPQQVAEGFCEECVAKFDEAGGCKVMHEMFSESAGISPESLASHIPDGCWPCGEDAVEHCTKEMLPPSGVPIDSDACIAALDTEGSCTLMSQGNVSEVMPAHCSGMGESCAEKVAMYCAQTSAHECSTARKGDGCFMHVLWGMETGIVVNPQWYPGLSRQSSFEDFQGLLHLRGQHNCPAPCRKLPPSFCHTASAGEDCHRHVTWAMQVGIKTMPAMYPATLTEDSSFESFQAFLHHIHHGDCLAPCEV